MDNTDIIALIGSKCDYDTYYHLCLAHKDYYITQKDQLAKAKKLYITFTLESLIDVSRKRYNVSLLWRKRQLIERLFKCYNGKTGMLPKAVMNNQMIMKGFSTAEKEHFQQIVIHSSSDL